VIVGETPHGGDGTRRPGQGYDGIGSKADVTLAHCEVSSYAESRRSIGRIAIELWLRVL